jgi:hypothetical protein
MTCRRVDRTVGGWALAALLAVLLGLVAATPAAALPRLPACADNLENDVPSDSRIDWPLDPGCTSATDTTEFDPVTGQNPVTQCSDGSANDFDGKNDFPADPGCQTAGDNSESTSVTAQCSDGANNSDGDTAVDFPADPGCIAANDNSELNVQCADAVDNDNDLRIDFPADWGCSVPVSVNQPPGVNQADTVETDPAECDDGRDNDGDGTLDFGVVAGQTADSDCASANDTVEGTPPPPPQCSDGFDNDIDGAFDFPADPGCSSPGDNDETNPPQCSDGLDNDGDGRIDFGSDPGCDSATDNDETNTVQYVLPTPPPPPPPPLSGSGTPQPVAALKLLTPFPIVRLRGTVDGKGVRVSLLTVRAPVGSKVSIYCSGSSCPRRRVAVKAGRKLVRVRQFERRLRGGTVLKIYVTKPGFLGKYTRFRFQNKQAPLRSDRCASTPGTKPRLCPSS